MANWKAGVAIGMMILVFLACEAPRLNPLDPRADNALDRVETVIDVRHLLQTTQGIAGVLVVAPELQLAGVTNEQGRVTWVHPRVDTLHVELSKAGFFTTQYDFPIRANSNQFFAFLNARPIVKQLKFVTIHNSASQVDYIRLEVLIDDPDGEADIQRAILQLPDSNFSRPLNRNDSTFQVQFNKTQISPTITAGQLPGLDFQLIIYNTNGDSIVVTPLVLRRIIDISLTPLLPNSDRAESGTILFTWKAVALDYPFNFRVILYSSTGTIAKIGEFYPISGTATQFELADEEFLQNMETGTYLWNLEVEDQFGNIAESQVLQFQYFK